MRKSVIQGRCELWQEDHVAKGRAEGAIPFLWGRRAEVARFLSAEFRERIPSRENSRAKAPAGWNMVSLGKGKP